MSGELTLNQFRYTTTNNRDFVIGDPSDTNEQPRYMVFQVNSTPGYANNPHIKAEKVGDDWKISISEDGATPLNFAFIDRENYFTYPNHFQAPTTFTSDVEINADLTVQGQAFTPSLVGYLAGNNIFTGYNTFTKDAIFDGTLDVQGRIRNIHKNILLNNGGASSSTVGAGLDISGDTGAIVSYVRNTLTGIEVKSVGLQPVQITGDTDYKYTIKPAGPLPQETSYVLPPQDIDNTIITAEPVSGNKPFTVNERIIVNVDEYRVAQSSLSIAELSTIASANSLYLKKAGDTMSANTFTFSGTSFVQLSGTYDEIKMGFRRTEETNNSFGIYSQGKFGWSSSNAATFDTFLSSGAPGTLQITGTGSAYDKTNVGIVEVGVVKAQVVAADDLLGNGAQLTNVNAVTLGGQVPSYYDCGGSCSWTCMTTCKGACTTTCTGGCGGTCSGNCGGTCQGTCINQCTTTCQGGCTGTCTGGCGGTCTGGCGAACATNCTGTCKNYCTGCSSCTESCTGCSGHK